MTATDEAVGLLDANEYEMAIGMGTRPKTGLRRSRRFGKMTRQNSPKITTRLAGLKA